MIEQKVRIRSICDEIGSISGNNIVEISNLIFAIEETGKDIEKLTVEKLLLLNRAIKNGELNYL